MGRTPCCDKYNVKRGLWSPEEDATLKKYIEEHGIGGSWMSLPLKAGLKRCGKSCRLRWINYLRPDIRREAFTEAENNIICTLYRSIGNRWSAIAAQLPGRTDNDVKNHWNTRLKKRLLSDTGSSSTGANRTNTNSDKTGAVATNIRYPDSAQLSVFASNQTHHLDLVNSPCRNAIPSTLLLHSDMGRQYQQYYYPQGLSLDQQSEFPLSSVPDASNAVGTSESNSYSKSSSQEITTLSSSPSLALDTNQYPSSCFGGGGVNNQPDDGLLLDYGLDTLSVTFDDLIGFQGTCCNVVPPHLGDPLFNY